jgi:DNA-binding response OmpR family regulator
MSSDSALVDVIARSGPVLVAREPAAGVTAVAPASVARPSWRAGDVHGSKRASAGAVLVIESDAGVGRVLVEQLEADGYRAELAHTAEHARMLARRSQLRLALLGELDSPRGALELLQEMRDTAPGRADWARDLPVIMLGAGANDLDMLRAFDSGADDFLVRPVRYLELRARLQALLRRAEQAATPVRRLTIGPLEIDLDGHAVSLYGIPIDLRRLEFELLAQLASDPERVFSKQELLRVVWGYRSSGSTRTIDTHASRLRRKLDVDGGGRWVINVWGVGYRLL